MGENKSQFRILILASQSSILNMYGCSSRYTVLLCSIVPSKTPLSLLVPRTDESYEHRTVQQRISLSLHRPYQMIHGGTEAFESVNNYYMKY